MAPPVSPAPWQREHCSERLTVILVVKPVTDSSNDNANGISISAPFLGIGRGGSGSRLALLPLKRSEKMSLKLPPPLPPGSKLNPEKSKPPAPPAAPPE